MAMMRRGSERGIVPLRDAFDRLIGEAIMPSGGEGWFGGGVFPPLDVRETDDAYIVEAEIPGMRPEDTEVTLEGRTLTIRGRFGDERREEAENYLLRERRSGSFVRAISLPAEIDADNASSTCENGELVLTLPKAPQNRARRIQISGGGQGARQVGSSTEAGGKQIGQEASDSIPQYPGQGEQEKRSER
jgi:HSP20 family protein